MWQVKWRMWSALSPNVLYKLSEGIYLKSSYKCSHFLKNFKEIVSTVYRTSLVCVVVMRVFQPAGRAMEKPEQPEERDMCGPDHPFCVRTAQGTDHTDFTMSIKDQWWNRERHSKEQPYCLCCPLYENYMWWRKPYLCIRSHFHKVAQNGPSL